MDGSSLRLEDEDLFSDIPNNIPKEIVDRYKEILNQKMNQNKIQRDIAVPEREYNDFKEKVINVKAGIKEPNYIHNNQQETGYNRVCDSIKEMEKRAIARIKTAAAGELSNTYLAKIKYAKFLENNIGKAISVDGQELSLNGNMLIDEEIRKNNLSTKYDSKFYEIVSSVSTGDIVAKRVTAESAARAQHDAEFYLNEVAKYDYMTEAIAASNGDKSYVNKNGDLTEVDILDKTFMVSYNNYENAMHNLDAGNELYEQEVGFEHKIARTGNDLHKQFGQSYAIAGRLERDRINSQSEVTPLPSAYKYEILKRERALSDAQKAKVISAVTVGVCIVGVTASFAVQKNMGLFNIEQVVQHELQSLTSFESMVIYFKDLGPLTTLLTAASAGAIVKYFKNSKKLKNAQHDMEDFSTAYMNYVDELGSDQIDRAR